MIVENMAGAASLTAANHIYNVAPKDGTVIGNFSQALLLNQITGGEGVNLDMAKFEWLGAISDVTLACLARDETGVKSFADAVAPASKRVVLGSSAPGSTSYDYPLVASQLAGANFKIVTGYPGNAEIRLAIEKNEVEGYCVGWEVLKPTLQAWDVGGTVKYSIFIQFPPEGRKHPEMANVPVIWDFVKAEDRPLIKLLISPEQFMWPFAVPPGTPPDRIAALRKAMFDSFEDPELNADAQKAKWDKRPVTGEKIQVLVKDVLDTPAPLVARFKELYKAKP
jgi:tripartite-type tricarboxylate transporter receptor subunit TctC